MANETNPGDLVQGLVRENWGDRYVKALYEKNYVLPYFANLTGDFKKGDIANVPIAPTLTVGTISSTGDLNAQVDTHTNVQVSIGSNKDVTVVLTGITMEQAEDALEKNFPGQAADALRQKMELDALALFPADVSNAAIGDATAPGNIGEDEILAAIQAALTAKMPVLQKPDEFCFALADNQFSGLRKAKIFDFNVTGQAGMAASSRLDMPSYGGVPIRFSTQVATSGSLRKNAFFHSSAVAWAAQRNVEPRVADMLPSGKDAKIMTAISLYGVKTVVASRFWIINSPV
jgi:hypothetical protein